MCRLEQFCVVEAIVPSSVATSYYLAAFFLSFSKLRCVMYSLFVCFSLFSLSFYLFLCCFLFCEYLCVLCVLSTYMLCVFVCCFFVSM